jgi:hypothetical protein
MQTVKQNSLPSFPSFLVPLWGVLLVLRAIAAFAGVTYLPLTPSVPAEVLMNDPALALSRGLGLVAPSFAHSINGFDRMYAHFPPVFLFLQSLVYRTFGFSASSVRLLGGCAEVASLAVFALAFREFFRRGFIDRLGLVAGSVLILLEPTTLIQARQGRMESTNILFGSIAFLLTLLADRLIGWEMPLWIASSVFCGLSLSTHPSAILFVPVLGLWSLMRVRRFGWVRWLGVNALPLVVFGGIWGLTYGANSIAALRQMQRLSGYTPPSLGLAMLAGAVRDRAAGQLQQSGSLALILIVVAPVLACLRLFLAKGSGAAPAVWKKLLAGAAVALFLQCAVIAWYLPWSGPNRIVMATPFGFFCLALAISWLPGRAERPAIALAVAFLLAEIAVTGGYFHQLHRTPECGPDRLDAVVDSIPPQSRVAAVPEFWYAFQHKGRAFSFIYHAADEDRYWNQAPGAFDEYDTVILDPVTPDYRNLLGRARMGRTTERAIHTCRREFTLLSR